MTEEFDELLRDERIILEAYPTGEGEYRWEAYYMGLAGLVCSGDTAEEAVAELRRMRPLYIEKRKSLESIRESAEATRRIMERRRGISKG